LLTIPQDAEWTLDSFNVTIPCIGLSYTIGELLLASPSSAVRLAVVADVTIAHTFNVIAEVLGGDLVDEKVVIGAHLDSIEEGPGINDNGSG
jgi:Zn-dependent M28 family amino/carboxypeptidase